LHIDYQLPNGHTGVGYLLDGIEYDDAPLQVVITMVEKDAAARGKRSEFEKASAHILPKEPVIKEDSRRRRG